MQLYQASRQDYTESSGSARRPPRAGPSAPSASSSRHPIPAHSAPAPTASSTPVPSAPAKVHQGQFLLIVHQVPGLSQHQDQFLQQQMLPAPGYLPGHSSLHIRCKVTLLLVNMAATGRRVRSLLLTVQMLENNSCFLVNLMDLCICAAKCVLDLSICAGPMYLC